MTVFLHSAHVYMHFFTYIHLCGRSQAYKHTLRVCLFIYNSQNYDLIKFVVSSFLRWKLHEHFAYKIRQLISVTK